MTTNKKRIIFVRHGESTFNEWRWRRNICCIVCSYCEGDPLLWDAPLSGKGEEQVLSLRSAWAEKRLDEQVGLVVTSPLSRAVQTCLATVGEFDGDMSPANRLAYSQGTVGLLDTKGKLKPRLVVRSECREHLGSSCDVGSSTDVLKERFPSVSFEGIEDDWWRPRDEAGALIPPKEGDIVDGENMVIVESTASLKARVQEFREWCSQQPEDVIAVFAHCHFIRHMLGGAPPSNCQMKEMFIEAATTSSGAPMQNVVKNL